MKKTTILLAGLMLSAATYAQNWKLDKAHSRVGFTVTHMLVSDVDGNFKTFDAAINSSKADFSDAVFSFTAQTNSISTDNEKRDGHLKTADFFDAEKYPEISFKSKAINMTGDKKFVMTGDLTMHGVTKTIQLTGSYRGPAEHPMTKKPNAGFKITGKIKRSDFNIGNATPNAIVSDEVEIIANGEFQKG